MMMRSRRVRMIGYGIGIWDCFLLLAWSSNREKNTSLW